MIIFILYMFWKSIRQSKKSREIINTNIQPAMNLKPIDEYLNLDPNFDSEKIKSLIANLYVQMQDTWHAKNINSLRPYMTDEFFNQMDRQLEAFRKTGRTDYTENIAVLDVNLKGFRQSGGKDYVVVGLISRITSYVLDDRTGELLSGSKDREKFMEYEIELSRKTGILTGFDDSEIHTETCPNCGAPLKLNASAQCEYCGCVITSVNTSWAISNMKGLSQRTA